MLFDFFLLVWFLLFAIGVPPEPKVIQTTAGLGNWPPHPVCHHHHHLGRYINVRLRTVGGLVNKIFVLKMPFPTISRKRSFRPGRLGVVEKMGEIGRKWRLTTTLMAPLLLCI